MRIPFSKWGLSKPETQMRLKNWEKFGLLCIFLLCQMAKQHVCVLGGQMCEVRNEKGAKRSMLPFLLALSVCSFSCVTSLILSPWQN